MSKWRWEVVEPLRAAGAAGDLTKLFKNEQIKQPGALAEDGPSADATILVRETIQNSWDAAREWQHDRSEVGLESPDFEIDFVFRTYTGPEKKSLVDAMGLGELQDRISTVVEKSKTERSKLGLAPNDCLSNLDDDVPLRVLEIAEHGTTGMGGPLTSPYSKMFLALLSIGFTVKVDGSGGSYGYGKAGLIRGSATRNVFAYTCFSDDDWPSDPGITRRLLGVTYWGTHEYPGLHEADAQSCTGFARFGSGDTGMVPFENDSADMIADQLGIARRDPSKLDDRGTTFLLVDATVTAEDIRKAVERNWWPAIHKHRFTVTITDDDGSVLHARPMRDPVLKSFIRGFDLAEMRQDNALPGNEFRQVFSKTSVTPGPISLGSLGLVADLDGWSYPQTKNTVPADEGDDDTPLATDVEHRSLIALVRSPMMVVEYLELRNGPPYVRGAFIADSEADDYLRQTEPAMHDSWDAASANDSSDPAAGEVARIVVKRIRTYATKFRNLIKPPTPEPDDIDLPMLDELFRNLISGPGKKKKGPDPVERPVSISLEQHPEPAESDQVKIKAKVKVSLSSKYKGDPVQSFDVDIRYLFLEDERAGDAAVIRVKMPDGFSEVVEGRIFRGQLSTEPAVFKVTSQPYSKDWTGRLQVSADPTGTGTSTINIPVTDEFDDEAES